MAKIKHIAIRTRDVKKTAAFYREVFELKEVGLGKHGVYLSDGQINLAILNIEPGDSPRLGVDHLGFLVEDVPKTMKRVTQSDGKPLAEIVQIKPQDPSHPQSYFESKCEGPDGQEIDLSSVGWVGGE